MGMESEAFDIDAQEDTKDDDSYTSLHTSPTNPEKRDHTLPLLDEDREEVFFNEQHDFNSFNDQMRPQPKVEKSKTTQDLVDRLNSAEEAYDGEKKKVQNDRACGQKLLGFTSEQMTQMMRHNGPATLDEILEVSREPNFRERMGLDTQGS